MTLGLRPIAGAELREAVLFYEADYPGRGWRFLERVSATLDAIASMPLSFPAEPGVAGVRTARVLGFPYRILFLFHDEHVDVLAVAHAKRRPDYWKARTK